MLCGPKTFTHEHLFMEEIIYFIVLYNKKSCKLSFNLYLTGLALIFKKIIYYLFKFFNNETFLIECFSQYTMSSCTKLMHHPNEDAFENSNNYDHVIIKSNSRSRVGARRSRQPRQPRGIIKNPST